LISDRSNGSILDIETPGRVSGARHDPGARCGRGRKPLILAQVTALAALRTEGRAQSAESPEAAIFRQKV
jgi:hypothetical protein